MTEPTPKKKWSRALDLALWAVIAGFVLYRFVLPVPSASLSPELASARLETTGKPLVVEFTSTR
jgi:hypothetical protein